MEYKGKHKSAYVVYEMITFNKHFDFLNMDIT